VHAGAAAAAARRPLALRLERDGRFLPCGRVAVARSLLQDPEPCRAYRRTRRGTSVARRREGAFRQAEPRRPLRRRSCVPSRDALACCKGRGARSEKRSGARSADALQPARREVSRTPTLARKRSQAGEGAPPFARLREKVDARNARPDEGFGQKPFALLRAAEGDPTVEIESTIASVNQNSMVLWPHDRTEEAPSITASRKG
jgi:hypothetical protein